MAARDTKNATLRGVKVPRGADEVRIVSASGIDVCARCRVAATVARRLRGLLARPAPSAAAGLLLRPCASVHTLFLRQPIDVVFVAGQGDVIRVVASLAPWRAASQRGAAAVLELAPGTCARLGILAGDRLVAVAVT